MPFTALNHAASTSASHGGSELPPHVTEAFVDIPADITSIIADLWNGKLLNKHASQKVITALAEHITSLKQQTTAAPASSSQDESSSKKRALEDAGGLQGASQEKKVKLAERAASSTSKASVSASWKGETFDGVSFTVPQRKKFSLKISPAADEGLSVSISGSAAPEFGIPWSEMETVMCLPVPEKTQAQKSFVIFPRGVNGLEDSQSADYETIVWTAPDTKAKGAAEDEPTQAQAIKAALAQNATVLEPNPKDFTSEIPPVGGKKDSKAYHIKAFRGSKDGFLFLLPKGIIWAFKKPLILFSFASIDSVSYTSVLQRTFNLVISARATPEATTTDYEFSMLDQADFAGIDAYIRKNGLQDASLAEQRRAKVYNVNGKKGEVDEDANGAANGPGELAKAEAEAAAANESSDDEEEDENFDPGSESDDGGSGESSEDEDAVGGPSGKEDLVSKELGSEAEDVELSDEAEAESDGD